MLNNVQETAARIGLRVNFLICKKLIVIFINSLQAEEVPGFKHLGSLIPNGQMILNPKWSAKRRNYNLDNGCQKCPLQVGTLLSRYEITIKKKARAHIAKIRSILLYGCKLWSMRVEDIKDTGSHWRKFCLHAASFKQYLHHRVQTSLIRFTFFVAHQKNCHIFRYTLSSVRSDVKSGVG